MSEWRAAERKLAELVPDTPDWAKTLSEVDVLRAQYQDIFKAARREA